jgi:hypothetical protein
VDTNDIEDCPRSEIWQWSMSATIAKKAFKEKWHMCIRHCASLSGFGLCSRFDIDTDKHYVSDRAESVAERKKLLKVSMMMNK